jgi:hypothetical protein
MSPSPKRFFGKYRGTVIDNVDPELRGRIKAQVPDVYGELPGPWALPAMPVTSLEGGVFAVPGIGASVWIEFEQGRAAFPVWTGGFWPNPGEVPATSALGADTKIVLQTSLGNFLVLDDETEGVTLQTSVGHSIMLNAEGITIKTSTGNLLSVSDAGITMTTAEGGSISIAGEVVMINDGALMVI